MGDRWEFANDSFRRGERKLLCDIHRRKVVLQPSPPPAPADSGEDPAVSFVNSSDLSDENNRLRKENDKMHRELSYLKRLCDDVLCLLSGYSSQKDEQSRQKLEENGSSSLAGEMGAERDNHPKIFGVSIGSKRARNVEEPCSSESPRAMPAM